MTKSSSLHDAPLGELAIILRRFPYITPRITPSVEVISSLNTPANERLCTYARENIKLVLRHARPSKFVATQKHAVKELRRRLNIRPTVVL